MSDVDKKRQKSSKSTISHAAASTNKGKRPMSA
jgi:hypothetical protein